MTDIEVIVRTREMAEESLSPEVFEKWEDVEKWLRINRQNSLKTNEPNWRENDG